ncbi:hypothetical protein G7Y89_g3376 [Cudoniella acicularis]|uniref:Uncharacterized protein n=1 Tax=Cudoniella acicularis TaxID=354080 RepID=A0A8H4RTD0_9HELO|nr:hypothetical protein G7Y89_g3376 [Cudoniella acicularis]
MAFVAGFGLDLAVSALSLSQTFADQGGQTTVQIGIGSQARDETGPDTCGGTYPSVYLFDTHGDITATDPGIVGVGPGSNEDSSFQTDSTITPEYMKLVASSSDATCIAYASLTTPGGDHRTWHAGYVKQCNDLKNGNIWYPSPELIPGTDFRPGCVWLSNDERFLQAISFKMTDFGFPETQQAQDMQDQYTQFPNTLCQAPGRMAMWETMDGEAAFCIPFYDFDVVKDPNGFDVDFQRIVSGHTLGCNMGSSTFFHQLIIPGFGPKTLTPAQEAAANASASASSASAAAAKTSAAAAQESANEAGTNKNAPPDGAGNMGGILGDIPASDAGGSEFTIPATAAPSTFVSPQSTVLATAAASTISSPPESTILATATLSTVASPQLTTLATAAASTIASPEESTQESTTPAPAAPSTDLSAPTTGPEPNSPPDGAGNNGAS